MMNYNLWHINNVDVQFVIKNGPRK